MRTVLNVASAALLLAGQLAATAPAWAAPQGRPSHGGGHSGGGHPGGGGRPPGGNGGGWNNGGGRPPGGGGSGWNNGNQRPPGGGNGWNNNRPPNGNWNGNRPPNGNWNGNNRPPGWNNGYHRPPPPPGWGRPPIGYYPPPHYYYNYGPSTGEVIAGVAVTAGLLALLSASNQPSTTYVVPQNAPPAPVYAPPANSTGEPARISVDLSALPSDARPSASTCIFEAAKQIGATGGTDIRMQNVGNVEKGNGGYRFRLTLEAVYPDQVRIVPMYCRATPTQIVELTFG